MLDIKLKLSPGHTDKRDWMSPSGLKKLFWNVTYACNASCGICFTDASRRHEEELTTEEGKAVLRDAQASGVEDIIISGGEPFMREDLVELLAFMGELGITARIATNGSLVTEELLDRLRAETRVRSFQVSVDTLDPELNAALHGWPVEMFERSLAALRHMQDRGFHTTVSTRVSPHTLGGIPALLDRAAQERWATVTLHLPLHTRRTDGAWPQDVDLIELLEPALEHFMGLDEQWVIETYIPWVEHHPVIRRLEERACLIHRGCRAGRDRLTINPTGAISPCVCLDVEDAYVGNVRQDRLSDVFRTSALCDLFRHPKDHGICEDCGHVLTCGGGCRASAYAQAQRLDDQDQTCPVWKAKALCAAHDKS